MVVVMVLTLVVIALYIALISWFYTGIQESRLASNLINEFPAVSIVVSFRNESENVLGLLNGLLVLDYPKEKLEIILVNDHSSDNTLALLNSFKSSTVKVVNSTGDGKKQAIETAVNIASGEWILMTDADCEIPKSWVKSMVSRISSKSKMILGPVFIKNTHSFLGQLQSIEFLGLQGTTCGSAGKGHPVSANAANMLFRLETFKELNPYHNNYDLKTGDDQFLLMAVTNAYPESVGYSLNKGSIIFTYPVPTWKKYFNQRIRWASKGSAYTQHFPKMVGLLVLVVSIFIIVDLNIGFLTNNLKLMFLPFLVKMAVDFLVIYPMKRFSRVKVNLLYYPLSTLVYSFVVVFTVIAGWVKK